MKTRLSKVLACLFAGILTATLADFSVFAAEESPDIDYYVCPNSKILKYDETDYSGMTANGKLLFSAAANERESAQIILTKPGTYKKFTLYLAEDLKDENKNTIKKENFEIYFEHYVKAEQFYNLSGSHGGENEKVSWDMYPDALIPYDLAIDTDIPEEKRANTFTLDTQKKNQGLWFTVTVPPGTPAGTYEGKLVGSLEIEVEVKVFDFELDTVTNSRTCFSVSPEHLPAPKNCREEYIHDIIGMDTSSYGVDTVKIEYERSIDELLNERKISSGSNYGVFYGKSSIDTDIDGLIKHIKDDSQRAPYYNLYAGYDGKKAPITLDCKKGPETVLDDFINKSGITSLSDDDKKVLKYAIKMTGSDADRNQGKIAEQLDTIYKSVDVEKAKEILGTDADEERVKKIREVASFFGYLLRSGEARLNRYPVKENGIGLEMVMKKIADRCVQDKFDYFQYAFIRLSQDDEADFQSFWANIRTLVNNYIWDETRNEVKKYVDGKQTISTELKNRLQKSLDNIPYLNTVSLTEKQSDISIEKSGNMSDLLYLGLEGIADKDVWNYYKDFCCTVYGKENVFYEEYTFFTGETVDIKNADGKITKQPVTSTHKIEIPMSFKLDAFCPPFSSFSASDEVKNKPSQLSQTLSSHQDNGTKFWWYSTLVSGRSASLAGYMINENHGTNTAYTGASKLSMDSLAVARANKWQQFNLGILGELYWGVDAFYFEYDPNNRNVHDKYSIPRASHYSYEVEDRDKDLICGHKYLKTDIGITATNGDDYTAGDGMLIYPVKQLLKNVYGITDESKLDSMAANYGYFLSSIRLENIGEANDDYDYLCFAKQLVNSKPDYPEYRNRLNSIIQMVIKPGNVDYTDPELTNPSNLTRARNMLAALIEGRFGNIKEVTNDGVNNKFTAAIDGVPIVKKWHTSNKVLCFDVCETDTYQNSNGSRCVTISLMTSERQRLNKLIDINFATKKIDKCEGATLVHKGAGWYTVQIPLNKVSLNTTEGEVANGDETLSEVYFDKRYVYRSFLVDNFRILKEVTNDGRNNTFTSTTDGVPVINKWKYSNLALCFDVCETDTYQNSNGSRCVSISLMTSDLMTSEWHRLNQLMTIDFEAGKITNCPDAAMVPKGNGWYTVQIPLKNVSLNLNPKEPTDGNETLFMVHFMKDYVYRSFLVDNFRIETAIGNGDLNGDGKSDNADATTSLNYLARNGAPPQNVWEADLDHNGVLNAVDLTLLKRMQVTQ